MAMTDLICFKQALVFRNNWIRFCAKILTVNSKAILCMGRGGVYVCVCVCVGGRGVGLVARGKQYCCDWKHTIDNVAEKDDNDWSV